jgi:hypothetical protein
VGKWPQKVGKNPFFHKIFSSSPKQKWAEGGQSPFFLTKLGSDFHPISNKNRKKETVKPPSFKIPLLL